MITNKNPSDIINKGTGAGGKHTNLHGKKFEEVTDQEHNLISIGFERKTLTQAKFGYYLLGQINNSKIIFVKQSGFKVYMRKNYNIDCIRCPDEVQSDYKECEQRFNLLKNGYTFDRYGPMSFHDLFKNNPCNNIEPDWEFPKGKRIEGENDQQCAVRESCEETAFEPGDFNVYLHVKPFQEKFMGGQFC